MNPYCHRAPGVSLPKIAATCVAFLLGLACLGQGGSTRAQLARIKAEYRRINTIKGLRVDSLDADRFLEQAPDNGATLTGYFKGDSLLKMVAWIGLSNQVVQRDYYCRDGRPFFILVTVTPYGYDPKCEAIDYDHPGKPYSFRYYLDGKRLLRSVPAPHQPPPLTVPELLAEARDFARVLRQR